MPLPLTDRVCATHLDRAGTLACASCGNGMCPSCTHTGDGAPLCPICVRQPGAAAVTEPVATPKPTPRVHRPLVTVAILVACVAIFFYDWWTLGDWVVTGGHRQIWQIPEGGLGDFALYRPQLAAEGEWYRVFTSGFIHFNLVHLAVNMLALWTLGRVVEASLGALTFATIFGAGIVGGSLGAVIVESDVQVGGASGAIFGLLGAIAMLQLVAGKNVLGIAGLIMVNVGFSFLPYVAIGGHLGGLAVGALAGLVVGVCRRSGPKALAIAPSLVAGLSLGVFAVLVRVVAPAQSIFGT